MGKLEDISLWYKYKEQVWPSANRPDLRDEELLDETQKTIHNMVRLFRCISSPGLAYLSCPVSSGKDLYDRLVGCRPEDATEIKKAFMFHNHARSLQFLADLEGRVSVPILYPGNYEPAWQKWEQPHFQALWLELISEKATEMHMADDWQYSTGASEELTHAFQLRLGLPRSNRLVYERKVDGPVKVYDSIGDEMGISESLAKIREAVAYVRRKGFNVERLVHCRNVLAKTERMTGRS